jgi:hypothetical protein
LMGAVPIRAVVVAISIRELIDNWQGTAAAESKDAAVPPAAVLPCPERLAMRAQGPAGVADDSVIFT